MEKRVPSQADNQGSGKAREKGREAPDVGAPRLLLVLLGIGVGAALWFALELLEKLLEWIYRCGGR